MSYAIALFRTAIKTKIRADLAVPVVSDLDDASITQWGDEHVHTVMHMLHQAMLDLGQEADLADVFEELTVYDTAVTFTSGSAVKTSGMFSVINFVVNSDSITSRKARIVSLKEFRGMDSRNFVLTPDVEHPIVTLAGNAIKVSPTTITAGKVDYIKDHPTIANGVLLNAQGFSALVYLVIAEYYDFIGQLGRAPEYRALAKEVLYGDTRKQIKI